MLFHFPTELRINDDGPWIIGGFGRDCCVDERRKVFLNAVCASGSACGWYDRGTILRHGVGDTWSVESSGTMASLRGIWGTGPNDIYVVGEFGTVLHKK